MDTAKDLCVVKLERVKSRWVTPLEIVEKYRIEHCEYTAV